MPIEKISHDDALAQSANPVTENIAALRTLFPQAFAEGKIDFDTLRQLLGDAVDDGDERYGLNWSGKRAARRLALTPSMGTLRPTKLDSVDWDSTRNLLIEGDNLEVLKLLQKSYAGKVKLIYIDPPYNTGNAMLYPNKFADPIRTYLEVTGQTEGGARLTSNLRTDGRFHTNWLNIIYPVLQLAKSMLREDGVFIITIDENEIASVLILLEELFGKDECDIVPVTVVHNPRGVQGTNFSATHEYAVFVAKKGKKLIADRPIAEDEIDWSTLRNWGGESLRSDAKNCFYPILVKNGEVIGFGEVCADAFHPESHTVTVDGIDYVYPLDRSGIERKWRYARQTVDDIMPFLKAKKISGGFDIMLGKRGALQKTVWNEQKHDASVYGTQLVNQIFGANVFSFPKSLLSVIDCVAAATEDKEGIILDFFAGSGTTGHAVMAQNAADGGNRRYILVQLPEPLSPDNKDQKTAADFCDSLGKPRTIAELTKERLRRAGAKIKAEHPLFTGDTGFRAYKLASSNIRAWNPGEDLAADIEAHVNNLLPDRSTDDLLVELMLKTGLDLTTPMQTRMFGNKEAQCFGGGVLFTCFADISEAEGESLAEGLASWYAELKPETPTTIFFRDTGFESNQAKLNLCAILEQRIARKDLRLRSL